MPQLPYYTLSDWFKDCTRWAGYSYGPHRLPGTTPSWTASRGLDHLILSNTFVVGVFLRVHSQSLHVRGLEGLSETARGRVHDLGVVNWLVVVLVIDVGIDGDIARRNDFFTFCLPSNGTSSTCMYFVSDIQCRDHWEDWIQIRSSNYRFMRM